MIDTDKYEGHTEGPWVNFGGHIYSAKGEHIADTVLNMVIPQDKAYANTFLIADAPLLLEEVKDLQKKLDNLREYCHAEGYDIFNWEVKNIEAIE